MAGPTLALDLDITAPAVEGASIQGAPVNAATVPVAGKVEFWSNVQGTGAHYNAPTGVFVHEVEHIRGGKGLKIASIIFGALFSMLVAGLAWNFFVNDVSPLDSISLWWNLITGTEEPAPVVQKHKTKKFVVAEVEEDDAPKIKPVVPGRILPAPYRYLTNEMADQHHRRNIRMSGEEENIIREGLNHEFYYHHYKAVQDVLELRRDGSEAILREALQNGKFWMKMYAIFGLADFGYKVSEQDVKQAFAGSHDELRERFLSRFEGNECSLGCEYVLREAMNFLHAGPRLAVLKILGKNATQSTNDYMVAATFDGDEKVRSYAQLWLLRNPVEENEWWRVYNEIAVEDDEVNSDGVVESRQG